MIPPRPARGAHACPTRRAGLVALIALLVGASALGGSPAAAQDTSRDTAQDDTTQAAGDDVTLTVDTLAPRVVSSDGPPQLVLTGRVTNRSSAVVRDLVVRVQRGSALTGAKDTTNTLAGDGAAEGVRAAGVEVADTLAPGRDAPVTVRVPLRGPSGASLALTETGVYPLLVDVTGGAGSQTSSRLDAVRTLLPVVGVPGDAPVPARPPGRAAQVSVLYPIADRPRRLPVVPGAAPVLGDDELAASFAPGGRLAGLVDALARSAPPGSPAAGAVCLAVDADLLETAAAMADGYQVATPTGLVPGRGAATAGGWLAALRAQARGRCVVALPFADADVVATSRGNLTDLTTAARATGAQRVAALLGVAPLPDATWPAGGVLDERSLSDLATAGIRTLLLDAGVLDVGIPEGGVARMTGSAGGFPTAVALDPVAAAALTPGSPTASVTRPGGTAEPLGAQDALGVLALRATAGVPARQPPPVSVVAPPTRWAMSGPEAGAYLDGVSDLTRRGLVRPIDAGALAASRVADPSLPATSLRSPADDGTSDQPALAAAAVGRARVVRDQQRDLLAASEQDRAGTATPADFFDPLTGGLLRSLSATWRGDPPGQDAALTAVEGQMRDLRSGVSVVQPSGSYSLGSNDAPLPLTVENRLPVAVRVQVVIAPTQGLRAVPPAEQTVPAFGSRQFPVGIQVVRSGQFSVDAQARTPGGEPLGPTARLLLRSTAYGTITVWLTASAAVALVILASVRIVRRIRASRRPGGPDAAGRGGPRVPVDPSSRTLQQR